MKIRLSKESYLEFRQGSFDNWCIMGIQNTSHIYDLTDAEYYNTITLISQEIIILTSVHGYGC